MPKRRRAKGPASKRTAPKRKAARGRFGPDRVVGLLVGIGDFLAVLLVVFVAGLFVLPFAREPATVRALAATRAPWLLLVAALAILSLWASVRLFAGRRSGFVVHALLATLQAGSVGYGAAQGGAFHWTGGWKAFVLLFCLARLLGWGPRPT